MYAPFEALPLYGHETVGDARQVIVVEGENCRDALAAVTGRTVVSWAGGTQGAKHTDWSPFAGRNVVIWPEANKPGLSTADEIASIVTGLGCSVRVMTVMDEAVSDPRWMGQGSSGRVPSRWLRLQRLSATLRWQSLNGQTRTRSAGRFRRSRSPRCRAMVNSLGCPPERLQSCASLKSSRRGDFVFPGQSRNKRLSNMAMEMMLRRMKVDRATVHGFRSSFRDWAGNVSDFPRELIETALAHVIGDKAEQAYRRSDALEKRRLLMNEWAAYCAPQETAPAPKAKLRRRRN